MIHVANCHGHKLDARNYQDWLKGCAFFAAIGAKFDTLACWSAGIQDFDLDAAKATWLAAGGANDLQDITSVTLDCDKLSAAALELLGPLGGATKMQLLPGSDVHRVNRTNKDGEFAEACNILATHPGVPFYASGLAISDLADAIAGIQKIVHGLNVHAGWWTDLETGLPKDRNDGELICLMHSELSEAMEGVRKNLMDDKLPHRKMVEVELADTIIRILDYAGGRKLDVAGALIEKLAFNTCRPDHKIDSRKAADGKKF